MSQSMQSTPQQQLHPQSLQAVAGLPRLFVGQIPIDKDEHDLMPLFSTYGNVEKIKVVRALDGKSKGCAMVQFLRWTEAEAALEAINGTSPFDDAVHRPLLVRFANPRRNGALTFGSNESAIAPRKLFVGQISKDTSQRQLVELFSQYGVIEHTNILTSKGHAGCAFVQYAKWAACEAAIDALHDKHIMPGCEHALVVKFADAKRMDGGAGTSHNERGPIPNGNGGNAMPHAHHQNMQKNSAYMSGNHQYVHPNYMNGHGGYMNAMPSLVRNEGSAAVPACLSPGSPYPVPGVLPPFQQHREGTYHQGSPAGGKRGGLSSTGGSSSSDSLALHGDLPSDGAPPVLMEPNISLQPHTMPMVMSHQQEAYLMNQGMGNSHMAAANLQAMAAAGMLPGMAYVTPEGHLVNVGMMGLQHPTPNMLPPGMKMGMGVSDPYVYENKLFIGQIPYEATELDLWQVFSPIGDILELAVLRSGGVSKGCAFLTYATRHQAFEAIARCNGRQITKNKRLVVKFADNRSSSASTSSS